MKKLVLSILLLLGCLGSAYSQFDAQFSQYMFHNPAFNPAAVGEKDLIDVTGQHRMQWLGLKDSINNMNDFVTTVFSINSPLKIGNSAHGVGIRFLLDNFGLYTNQSAHVQYAYKIKLSSAVLSVGADVGFVSVGFDPARINPVTLGDYHDITNDPDIPRTVVSGMAFDMGLGVFYSTSDFYAGMSYSHINSPVVYWGDRMEFRPPGTMYLTGGYSWELPDTKYVLKPTTLLKTDFKSLQWDISGRLEYDSKYWGGLSYRIQDAVVLFAGMNISGGLAVGYSYDLPTSNLITVSSGSHELMLSYSFEYVFGKRTNRYKSIRIL